MEGTRLQLAMSDPMDRTLVSEIEFKTGARLAPLIALESAIKHAVSEARRALKAGQRTMVANVQKRRDTPPTATAAPAEAPAGPIPVAALEEKERAVFETLAGTPLRGQSPTAPVPASSRVPALEEVQTVLAVDDDENVLRLMERILESRRYRILT